VFLDSHVVEEHVQLGTDAERSPDSVHLFEQVDVLEAGFPRVGHEESSDHVDGRRLARAVVAQQREYVALLDHEVDVVDRGVAAEGLQQVADPEVVAVLRTLFVLLADWLLLFSRNLGQKVFLLGRGNHEVGFAPEGRFEEEEGALAGAVVLGQGVLEVERHDAEDDVGDDAALETVSRTEPVDARSHVAESQSRAVAFEGRNHDGLEEHEDHGQYAPTHHVFGDVDTGGLNDHDEDAAEVDEDAEDRSTPRGREQRAHQEGHRDGGH